MDDLQLRLATRADLPNLEALIDRSVRVLSADYYTPAQIDSALKYVFGPDTRLIDDGTYFVIETGVGELAAAGGWGRRRTIYGGDKMKSGADPLLDPATEPARVRAFYVHPDFARKGLARQLFERCATDATLAGFRALELMATLPGEPLYLALGFTPLDRITTELPGGERLAVVHMFRPLANHAF